VRLLRVCPYQCPVGQELLVDDGLMVLWLDEGIIHLSHQILVGCRQDNPLIDITGDSGMEDPISRNVEVGMPQVQMHPLTPSRTPG
jgi:hypothetical protein